MHSYVTHTHRLSLNACAAVQTSDSELMRKGTLEHPGLVSSCSSWRTVCSTCAAGQRSTLVTTTNVGMCRATENPKCSHVVPTGIECTTKKNEEKKRKKRTIILPLRKCEGKKKSGDAGDRTRGLSHAKRALYH